MPTSVDVAVVGAGVVGLSVARELRLAGVDRVVVLEREPAVGQGSSSRANGGVRAQFTTKANIEFTALRAGAPRRHRLRWSVWRRRHQQRARTCHYRRQAARDP